MIKKTVLTLLVVICGSVAAYFLVRHLTRTDEDRVRAVITGLISDLATDNPLLSTWGIQRKLSDKYVHRGEEVPIDKELTISYIMALKQNHGYIDFKVHIIELKITVNADAKTARAEITGRVTAATKTKPDQRIEIMTQPGLNKAIIDFAKEDADWLVTGSERIRYDLPKQESVRRGKAKEKRE